ncbi:MAG: prolipoprotein diacylglyceryl transferase [Anaerolineae bacterium]|jgi:phosphatidylglycerol---prolipoprotein diacylglyceryl transferase|nr:prolipoprotein diacylglyceryl transferase [Anaerolineae bacterium]MBT7071702.1 prolipoprotein diacylglyceryl transferase [Anaerolineae bacterium]MBT7325228.1 prolipoprotein diacylglyceryl transferase [Anaerolineae bacterium]
MIDPVIFSFNIGDFEFALRWYGVLVMLGAVAGTWLAATEIKRYGENEEHLWDAMVILLPVGILGARLWYVANATLGGNQYYMQNPGQILNIPQGGLHFYGGLLFGAAVLYWYARKHKLDLWLLLDALAPATLIGQAVARPANFINQELYGQPTTLPWGISIDSGNRLAQYSDMSLFPDTTRFHPAFAYEMVWNFFAAGLILWFVRRYPEKSKPGTALAAWLILAGIGRFLLEAFRPDQPRIPGTDVSFTRVVAALMAVAGVIALLVRNKIIKVPFAKKWAEKYKLAPPKVAEQEVEKKSRSHKKRRRRKR